MGWKNANVEIKDVGTLSGLTSNYIPEYAAEWPPSSVNYNNWREYVVPASSITIDWSKQTVINLKYGSIIFGADGYGYVQVRDDNNNIISEMRGVLHWMSGNTLYILGGIDEENQEGRIGVFLEPPSGTGTSIGWNNQNKNRQAYEFITQNALANAKIKVNYYLPDYDYTYAKITYKQDSEPASETDGESVEILKDETSVNIEGLEEEKTYYFKIFTDKSESEAFQYTVEVDPVPPEYKTYIDNINGTGFDWIRKLEQDTATITNSDRSTFTADMYKYYPMNKVTWYTHSHQGTDVENWNKTTFAGQTTALFVSSKIDKVEINSNNNVYSCTITKNNDSVTSPDRMFVYEKTVTMGGVYTKDTLPRGWYANFNYHSGYLAYGPNCNPFYLAGSWATRTFSGTLTEVFEQLQRYVRNIDVYVDGVLWSKAGN